MHKSDNSQNLPDNFTPKSYKYLSINIIVERMLMREEITQNKTVRNWKKIPTIIYLKSCTTLFTPTVTRYLYNINRGNYRLTADEQHDDVKKKYLDKKLTIKNLTLTLTME